MYTYAHACMCVRAFVYMCVSCRYVGGGQILLNDRVDRFQLPQNSKRDKCIGYHYGEIYEKEFTN